MKNAHVKIKKELKKNSASKIIPAAQNCEVMGKI